MYAYIMILHYRHVTVLNVDEINFVRRRYNQDLQLQKDHLKATFLTNVQIIRGTKKYDLLLSYATHCSATGRVRFGPVLSQSYQKNNAYKNSQNLSRTADQMNRFVVWTPAQYNTTREHFTNTTTGFAKCAWLRPVLNDRSRRIAKHNFTTPVIIYYITVQVLPRWKSTQLYN